jgi:CheY-like chemotaxis protein
MERLGNFPHTVIQTKLQKNLYNICCSPQHMHKVLLNLIGNSLEVVEENGMIQISTDNCKFSHPMAVGGLQESDYVKLSISDNGPGIRQEDTEFIFDPFYTTKVMGKSGTGLGLSIVWNIVQEHNGWIEIKNNNPGAIFEIHLPATQDSVCSFNDIQAADSFRGNGETILLIDDQLEQNEIISKALQNLGYITHSVTSGEEGLAFIRSHPVDLVLLDMMMGTGLNGPETFEQILKIHPQQKAIVVSGYAKSEEILKVRNLGVSDFIEKPVTISKISEAIKQSLACN